MSYEVWTSDPRSAQQLSELLGSMNGEMLRKAKATGSAYASWVAATGSRERTHTMGVYLAEPDDPSNRRHKRTLTVYVDSSAILQDFTTNANLYLMKLERAGLALDAVEFRLSRKQRPTRETSSSFDIRPNTHPAAQPTQEPAVSRETRTPEQAAALAARLEQVDNPALRESLRRAIGL